MPPFDLGPRSNGEYLPHPQTPKVREAIRRTLAHSDDAARRLGMSRRNFLHSLGGAATMLFFLAACDSEESASRDESPGGTFAVSTTSTTELAAAAEELTGDEFIFDVQTHLLDFDLSTGAVGGGFASSFPQANCGEDDWRSCFGQDYWFEQLFMQSDTTMAVISAVPILVLPNPLSMDVMAAARAAAGRACGDDGRVFLHGQVNPNVGEFATAADGMRALREEFPIGAWKVYTHVPQAQGWWLDDHDADAVQCGNAFLDVVREIGPRVVCVHKGFGGGSEYSSPVDIGPAAAANPDITFVVYHSGYEGPDEGLYAPEAGSVGVNRLLSSLDAAGIEPGANVYAELGSTWWNAMRDPGIAAHVLGKLLARVGEDRVLWGTDSIWYGSPQDQIQAFRTFEISEQFQEEYGYPALTDEVKRKVFGLNAAEIYDAEPVTARCPADQAALEELRAALPARISYGPSTAAEARVLMRAHGLNV